VPQLKVSVEVVALAGTSQRESLEKNVLPLPLPGAGTGSLRRSGGPAGRLRNGAQGPGRPRGVDLDPGPAGTEDEMTGAVIAAAAAASPSEMQMVALALLSRQKSGRTMAEK